MSQHYANFNRVYEELKVLFFISQDVKKMQKQCDQLAVLTFLGSLPLEYTPARLHVISSFAVDSLPENRFLKASTQGNHKIVLGMSPINGQL